MAHRPPGLQRRLHGSGVEINLDAPFPGQEQIPVDASDEEAAADNVAEGGRDHGFVDVHADADVRVGVPDGDGDEVHVCDDVVEAEGDEGGRGEPDGEDLGDDFARGEGHEDGEADEPVCCCGRIKLDGALLEETTRGVVTRRVTKGEKGLLTSNSPEEDLMPLRNKDLRSCEVEGLLPICRYIENAPVAGDDAHEEQHAGQVAKEGYNPALEEVKDADASVQQRDGHEHDVAGDEVCSRHDDHDKADGEE